MTKYIICFFLLININSQKKDFNVEVIYNLAQQKKNEDAAIVFPDIKFSLVFNKEKARFEHLENMKNDSKKNRDLLIVKGGGRGVYFEDKSIGKVLQQIEFSGEIFIIDKKDFQYNWELKKESKKILGYNCLKAIGTIKEYNPVLKKTETLTVVAWYAPNIANQFGPAEYFGLPGLVLESYKGGYYFIAESINFSSEKEILKLKKGIELTKKEFNDMLYKSFLDKFKE